MIINPIYLKLLILFLITILNKNYSHVMIIDTSMFLYKLFNFNSIFTK